MRGKPIILVWVVFCCIAGHRVAAQADSCRRGGFGVETNLLVGKIIRHTIKFTSPLPAVSGAFDVNFIWKSYGKRAWEQRRKYPQLGLGVTYTNYNSNRIFGQALGLYPNIQLPLLHSGKLEWTMRMGDGLGYVTRKYQRGNPQDTLNVAIGSHLNDYFVFLTDLRYHINEHWHVQCGANLTHISNAHYDNPNLGINLVGGHIGVQYFPETCNPERIVRELPKLSNRWLVQVRVGMGYTQANATDNPELPTYIVSGYISRRWWGKNKFYGGVDYAYHEGTYAFYKTWGIDIGHERGNAWDGTFFIGNEFLLGRIGIIAQAGYYYRKTYLKYGNDPMNEKLGFNIYLLKNERGLLKELFVAALLTTHSLDAEYAEFGLGVGL